MPDDIIPFRMEFVIPYVQFRKIFIMYFLSELILVSVYDCFDFQSGLGGCACDQIDNYLVVVKFIYLQILRVVTSREDSIQERFQRQYYLPRQ